MQVAICISGMPRAYKRCLPSIRQHLIAPHQADVFVSTWRSEVVDSQFPETDSAEGLVQALMPRKFDIELYNQARAQSFEIEEFKARSDQAGRAVGRMLPMFYKIYMANFHKLVHERERNMRYDVVVRARSDLMFNSQVRLVKPQASTVYFPKVNQQMGVNDQFWYCDSETADKIANLYLFIPDLWRAGMFIHGEFLLYSYLQTASIKCESVDVDYFLQR